MDNVYLIYGDEEFLIDKEIKNIINKFNSSMENVARYNLDESNVREAIEDACTISMFETNKIVICEKCNFLTGENKKEINHDIDSLIKYINNPFSDSVLIFVVRNPKLDERKKVVKELKKCSKVIECKTIENFNLNNYISNYFKTNNYEISQSDVKLIIDKVEFMTGRIITHALNGASSYVFFTATIGSGFDNYCRHLKSGDDELKIFVADMIGSVIAEAVVSWLMGKLKDLAKEEGWLISNNYSPGYCDWALIEQQKLFGFFPENITGIRLTDSCLMLPIKSVSGVVAIGVGIKKRPYGCSICRMPTCFRNKRRL